jgi:hypothetical protein
MLANRHSTGLRTIKNFKQRYAVKAALSAITVFDRSN